MTSFARLKATSAYKAAMLIMDEGPMMPTDLFARVDFGLTNTSRRQAISRAIASGLLVYANSGAIDITPEARDYFDSLDDDQEQSAKRYVGTPAAPRSMNVYERPPYRAPQRVIRADAPPLYPAGFQFRTIA